MALLKRPTKKGPLVGHWHRGPLSRSNERPHPLEKRAPCLAACPAGTDVRRAMGVVAQRDKLGLRHDEALDLAWRVIVETNPFPAVLGRVCPHPCEGECNRRDKDEPAAVALFERFVGEWGIARALAHPRSSDVPAGARPVAVVGAGPSGLACACYLARAGHAVTVFEADERPGGMLRYGIPTHRLGRGVLDAEIGKVLHLGVELRLGTRIGRELSFDEIRAAFGAVFVAIGAHNGRPLELPGARGTDVFTGVEFLRLAHSEGLPFDRARVTVIGDGETALDVARVANRLACRRRLPAGAVTLVRAAGATEDNLTEPISEGVVALHEMTAVGIHRDAAGRVTSVLLAPAALGEPDDRGVRLPVPRDGPRIELPTDAVVGAVSQQADWRGLGLGAGLGPQDVDAWGRTTLPGVWSGGDDLALGTAARSVYEGRRAALSIDATLRGQLVREPPAREPVRSGRVKLELYDPAPRTQPHRLSTAEGLAILDAELVQGAELAQALDEAARCLGCGTCIGCERCFLYCTPGSFARGKPAPTEPYFELNPAACDGCRKCADLCPTGYLEMV